MISFKYWKTDYCQSTPKMKRKQNIRIQNELRVNFNNHQDTFDNRIRAYLLGLTLIGVIFSSVNCIQALCNNANYLKWVLDEANQVDGHDFSQTIKILQALRNRNPNDVRSYIQIGNLWREQEEFDKARKWYNQAQIVLPSDSRPIQYLALTFLDEGKIYRRERKWEQALAILQESHRLDPKNPAPCTELGRVLYWGFHDSEQALAYFLLALQINPDDVDTRIWLARFNREEGNLTLSLENLQEAIDLAPNDPEVHAQMGVTLYQQGDFEAAIIQLEKAISISDSVDSSWFYQALGDAYRDAGKTQEAIAAFRKAPNSSYIEEQLEKLLEQ